MAITRPRKKVACGVLAAVAVFASALVVPPSAFAHASLIGTTPEQGAALVRSPAKVVLRFDEGVSTVAGSLRVYDSQVQRVDEGDVSKPSSDEVAVSLPGGLPDGTYTVAWRVLSADSHPIRGAFVFSVGQPSGDASGVIDEVLDAEAGSEAVDLSLGIVRFFGLALILLCVGGATLLAFVAEKRDARARLPWIVLASAAGLLVVDSLAWIALTGAKAAGFGLDAVFRWAPARDVLETGFGRVWLIRVLLALALATLAILAARSRSDRWLVPVVFLASAIAVTPALSGHARVEGPLAVVSDAIHVVAAGVWVGGLAFLALMLVEAGGDRWSLASRIVPRFSTLAVVSVIALVTAGVVSGFLEVRSWQALWHTTYGQLLLVKVALLVPLLVLGTFNNRVSVPRLRSAEAGPQTRRRFAGSVAAELALMIVVVGVTAALVAEPPAKAEVAIASGPVSREGKVGPYDFALIVDPARAGLNAVHFTLLDSTGQLAAVDEIKLSATLPAVAVGPLPLKSTPAGPGHVIAIARLPLAGDWQLEIAVRKGEFDQWSTVVQLPIRKDS
jgi:copper transport protein